MAEVGGEEGGVSEDFCAQCTTACPVAHCVLELLTLESDYVSNGQKQSYLCACRLR